MAKYWQTSA